ncbi:MAG: PIN domain-containing protein [Candidatus Competibacter sp.]|nr:PIN domain-containing protein [Candidatus Competibacter sp.]
MKKLRIYVDTSVIGGCFDSEFAEWSSALIEDFRKGRYRAVLSDVTAAEVLPAPDFVKNLHAELLSLPAQVIRVDEDAVSLVQHYIAHSVLGQRFMNDMLHIALATIAEVDVLVSWNFKHIVRLDKIRLFNAVNIEQGYKTLAIYSPREVISHGSED